MSNVQHIFCEMEDMVEFDLCRLVPIQLQEKATVFNRDVLEHRAGALVHDASF